MMGRVDELPGRIGAVIDRHIRPMFVPTAQLKATLLVRFEDDPEGRMDVLVTDDDDDGIRGIVTRRLGPPALSPAASAALTAARALLVADRASLWRSSISPVTGVIPEHHVDELAGVQAYDAAIELIDAALARPSG